METDVPKGWNRERGGRSRNHKKVSRGKSGRMKRVRARQRAAGRGCSEAGRGKKWGKKWPGGRGGGGGRGVREESGAGRGTPGIGARGAGRGGDEGGRAAGGGARAPQSSSALLRARGAACCRREERSGARRAETRNLASPARCGWARREEAAGRRPGPGLPRRFGEHRAGEGVGGAGRGGTGCPGMERR